MKLIELLLTESVENLGIVGDVVKVRPGYARNYLLPRAYATRPTPGAIKRLAARRAEVERELAERRKVLEALLAKLTGFELTMMRSANEQGVLFGGVSQHDIAKALQAEGLMVEDRMVRIGEQIKRLDSYTVPLVLAADLKTEIKLWVVSDKPMETTEEAGAAAASEDAPAEAEPEKPRKKGKKADAAAETAGEAPEADAAAEKPKKKARKGAGEEAKAE